MDKLINNLVTKFKQITPQDNEPIKMAIMELDKEYELIKNYGINKLNLKLKEFNLILIEHNEYPKGLKTISLEEISA